MLKGARRWLGATPGLASALAGAARVVLYRTPVSISSRACSLGLTLGLAAMLSCACRSAAEREMTAEAVALSSAIQALRAAPNEAKREPLERLKSLGCKDSRACETQLVCAQAYELHETSLELSGHLREYVAQGGPPGAKVDSLLALNEKNLADAKRMMDECLRLETALLVEARPK